MAGRNENSSVNSEATWIVGFALLVGLILGIWFMGRQFIVYPTFALKWLQVKVYDMLPWVEMGENGKNYQSYMESFFDGRRDATIVDFASYADTVHTVGEVMKYGMMGIIGCIAVLVAMKMKGDSFKREYKLIEFIRYQSLHWKTLTSAAIFNPDEASPNMATFLNPVPWMNKLGVKARLDHGELTEETHDVVMAAFAKQLGDPWRPLPKQPIHVRAMIGIFAAHWPGQMKVSAALRGEIDYVFTMVSDKNKRDAAIEAIIAPHLANDDVMKKLLVFTEKHSYTSTALLSMIFATRDAAGMLPSAEFRWLKELDRNLWYVMNDAGRRVAHIESAGVYAHFYHEKVGRRALIEPQLDGAITGLEEYLTVQGVDELEEEAA